MGRVHQDGREYDVFKAVSTSSRQGYIPGRVSRWRYSRVNIARCSYVLRVREARVWGPPPFFVSRFYFGRSIVKVMGPRKDGSPIYLRARVFTYICISMSLSHILPCLSFSFLSLVFFSFLIIND